VTSTNAMVARGTEPPGVTGSFSLGSRRAVRPADSATRPFPAKAYMASTSSSSDVTTSTQPRCTRAIPSQQWPDAITWDRVAMSPTSTSLQARCPQAAETSGSRTRPEPTPITPC
jgi:hypothetical protein